jgi:hypothetical protein
MAGKKNKIILALLVVIELIAMLAVWPGGFIRRDTMYSSGDTHAYVFTLPLYSGDECTQGFVSQGDVIKEHSFAVKRVGTLSSDWKLIYELKGSSGEVLAHEEFSGEQVTETGFRTVELGLKMKEGAEYTFTLRVEGSEGGIGITCTPYQEDFAPGVTGLYQNGEYLGIQSFGQYVYRQKLNFKNVIFTWLFMWILGGVLWEFIRREDRK